MSKMSASRAKKSLISRNFLFVYFMPLNEHLLNAYFGKTASLLELFVFSNLQNG